MVLFKKNSLTEEFDVKEKHDFENTEVKKLVSMRLMALRVAVFALALILITAFIPDINLKKAHEYLSAGETAKAAMYYGKAGKKEKSLELWREVFEYKTEVRANPEDPYTSFTAKINEDKTVSVDGKLLEGWKNIIALAAGNKKAFLVGLTKDGAVLLYGETVDSFYYERSVASAEKWKNVVAIECGDYHVIGLKANGTVKGAGYYVFPNNTVPATRGTLEIEDIVALSAKGNVSMFKTAGGEEIVLDKDYFNK